MWQKTAPSGSEKGGVAVNRHEQDPTGGSNRFSLDPVGTIVHKEIRLAGGFEGGVRKNNPKGLKNERTAVVWS